MQQDNIKKEFGKISDVRFGLCGYQDAQLGISFTLEGKGWGVNDTKAYWDSNMIEVTDNTIWSEEDRTKAYSEVMRYISTLLKDAKVSTIDHLQGKPVEVTFQDRTLKEWRILTEVL